MINLVFFYLLAGITLVFAFLTVTIQRPFHSVLCLAATLLGVSGLFLLLQAEFVAFMQILIYVGAVITITIFVIMLTKNIDEIKIVKDRPLKLLALLLICCLGAMLAIILLKFPAFLPVELETANDLEEIGKLFFGKYTLAFEITSVILLSALIGGIVIARDDD